MGNAIEKAIYKKNSNIVSRLIDEETILVPIRQKAGEIESVYTLNETGAYIWGLIDGKLKLRDISIKIAEKYNIAEEKATLDLKEIIQDLKEASCIEVAK